LATPDHATRGVRCAIAMQDRLAELNRRRVARGEPPLCVGVGVHTGTAVLGDVGASRPREDTALRDPLDAAARIPEAPKTAGGAWEGGGRGGGGVLPPRAGGGGGRARGAPGSGRGGPPPPPGGAAAAGGSGPALPAGRRAQPPQKSPRPPSPPPFPPMETPSE